MSSIKIVPISPQFLQSAGSANEHLVNQALRHAVNLERLKSAEVSGVMRILNSQVVPDVTSRVQATLLSLGDAAIPTKIARLQQRAAGVQGVLRAGLRNTVNKKMRSSLAALALTEADWQVRVLRNAVGPLALSFTQPSIQTLRALATSKPMNGKFLVDWYSDLADSTAKEVTRQLNIGVTLGETNDAIAKRILGTKSIPGGTMQQMRRNARTVTRTAVNHVSSEARKTTFAENQDIIKQVQYLSTLDARTSDICIALDGKTWDVGEDHPTPPMHHQCRSTLVPVLKSWKELGINLKEAPPGTRASMNGQVSSKLNYSQWLKKQPAKLQNQILGKGKAKLFRSGKLKLTKLTDQAHKPITLDGLRKSAGLKPTKTSTKVSLAQTPPKPIPKVATPTPKPEASVPSPKPPKPIPKASTPTPSLATPKPAFPPSKPVPTARTLNTFTQFDDVTGRWTSSKTLAASQINDVLEDLEAAHKVKVSPDAMHVIRKELNDLIGDDIVGLDGKFIAGIRELVDKDNAISFEIPTGLQTRVPRNKRSKFVVTAIVDDLDSQGQTHFFFESVASKPVVKLLDDLEDAHKLPDGPRKKATLARIAEQLEDLTSEEILGVDGVFFPGIKTLAHLKSNWQVDVPKVTIFKAKKAAAPKAKKITLVDALDDDGRLRVPKDLEVHLEESVTFLDDALNSVTATTATIEELAEELNDLLPFKVVDKSGKLLPSIKFIVASDGFDMVLSPKLLHGSTLKGKATLIKSLDSKGKLVIADNLLEELEGELLDLDDIVTATNKAGLDKKVKSVNSVLPYKIVDSKGFLLKGIKDIGPKSGGAIPLSNKIKGVTPKKLKKKKEAKSVVDLQETDGLYDRASKTFFLSPVDDVEEIAQLLQDLKIAHKTEGAVKAAGLKSVRKSLKQELGHNILDVDGKVFAGIDNIASGRVQLELPRSVKATTADVKLPASQAVKLQQIIDDPKFDKMFEDLVDDIAPTPSKKLDGLVDGKLLIPDDTFEAIFDEVQGLSEAALNHDVDIVKAFVSDINNKLGVKAFSSDGLLKPQIKFIFNKSDGSILPIPNVLKPEFKLKTKTASLLDKKTGLLDLPKGVDYSVVKHAMDNIETSFALGEGASIQKFALKQFDDLFPFKVLDDSGKLLPGIKGFKSNTTGAITSPTPGTPLSVSVAKVIKVTDSHQKTLAHDKFWVLEQTFEKRNTLDPVANKYILGVDGEELVLPNGKFKVGIRQVVNSKTGQILDIPPQYQVSPPKQVLVRPPVKKTLPRGGTIAGDAYDLASKTQSDAIAAYKGVGGAVAKADDIARINALAGQTVLDENGYWTKRFRRSKKGTIGPAVPEPVFGNKPNPFDNDATFPDADATLKKVKDLGGSTGAELVEDATGKLWVRKRGGNPEQLIEEFLAEDLYRKAGIRIPPSRLYTDSQGKFKLSEFIQGQPINELEGAARKAAFAEARQGYAADAIFANWDSVGLTGDNMLVDAAGRVWRIDVGGALRYRAQGGLKGKSFNGYPTELWSLKSPELYRQQGNFATKVFADLTHIERITQAESLLGARADILRAINDPTLKQIVAQRLDETANMVRTTREFLADRFKVTYLDDLTRHQMGIRETGAINKMSNNLIANSKGRHASGKLYSDDGKLWDDISGKGGATEDVINYLERHGGDYSAITKWQRDQASSSWAPNAQAAKYFFAKQTKDLDAFFWRDRGSVGNPWATAKAHYEQLNRASGGKLDQSLVAWHAYTYETMKKVKLPFSSRSKGHIRLVRTEETRVLKLHNADRPRTGVKFVRGACESCSLVRKVTVHGNARLPTIQLVPHTRVFGTWFQGRRLPEGGAKKPNGGWGPTFASSGENEITAMLRGLTSEVVHNEPSWRDTLSD